MLVCILFYHSEEERLSTHRGSSQLIELRQRGVASSFGRVDLDLGHHPTVFMVKNQEYGSDIRMLPFPSGHGVTQRRIISW